MRPHLVFGSVAAIIIVSPAQAFEHSRWEGFYGGLSLGQRMQVADWKQTALYNDDGIYLSDVNTSSSPHDGRGYVGVYGGYNWRLSDLLVSGFELSAGYANNEAMTQLYVNVPEVPGLLGAEFNPIATSSMISLESTWDVKLKGKLGYLVTPNTLLYGSAGLAVTQFKATASCTSPIGLLCINVSPEQTNSKTLLGWTAGLGIENALSSQITLRAEYQYTAYESASFMALEPFTIADHPVEGSGNAGVKGRVNLTTQTVTMGLTYKF